MISNKILLSVCVPTYNRPEKLRQMLSGLLPQMTTETELVVRDDSPNDESKKVLDELLAKFNPSCKFSYFHGEKIGLDAANLFLLEKATGEYIWWFSDDDEFMPGAIEHSLRLVKKYPEITFMWANFRDENRVAVDREGGFFKSGNDVLETLNIGHIGLLSALFLRREDALPSLPLAKKHIKGFSFAALVPVFHVLSGTGKFYFLRGPYVLCRPSVTADDLKKDASELKAEKNYFFDVFGEDFHGIISEFKDKFNRHAFRRILGNSFSSLWRGILVGWVGGWDTPRGKRWRMFKLYWSFPEIWIAMPLFLLPLWLNKAFYKLYKIFFSHRKWVFGKKAE